MTHLRILEWVKVGIGYFICRLILMNTSACMISYSIVVEGQRSDAATDSAPHHHHSELIGMTSRSSGIRRDICLSVACYHPHLTSPFNRSTLWQSQPHKAGLKCPFVRPSTKSYFDFNDIWLVSRGRWVMHDGMQYDPLQGQGHEPLKVGNLSIYKSYLLDHGFLN